MPSAWTIAKKTLLVLCAISVIILVLQYAFSSRNFTASYERIESFLSQHIAPKNILTRHSNPNSTSKNQQQQHNKITTPQPSNECQPNVHVLFLKTHKTGSSTITNILNRYTDTNNLTMLLPRMRHSYSFNWPNKFRLSAVTHTYTRPNILANHARYSRDSMDILFPRKDTFYITILRNPVPQFESSFQYFSFSSLLNIHTKKDPLKYFLDNPVKKEDIVSLARKYPSLNLVRNPLFYDLGLDYKDYDNTTFIENAIQTLDRDFGLVLLMESFDESLTLLRRRLCWKIDDVVYFKLNERLNKNRRKKSLSNETVAKIQKWNNADMALHEFFKRKFWKEVEKEGPDFHADVSRLKKRRAYYAEVCIEDEAIEQAYSYVYVKGYKMRTNLRGDTKRKCEQMLRNEIKFLDYFQDQNKKWRDDLEKGHIENFQDPVRSVNVEHSNGTRVANKL